MNLKAMAIVSLAGLAAATMGCGGGEPTAPPAASHVRYASDGTLVVFAAKHGETAMDGDAQNSPFALAFVRNIRTPGVEVRRLFDNVRDDVMEMTGHQQQPYSYGSISGRQDFYFTAAN